MEGRLEQAGNILNVQPVVAAPEPIPQIDLNAIDAAEELFRVLVNHGYTWEEIVNIFVLHRAANREAQAKNQSTMELLISYRDAIDYQIYLQAAKNLFTDITKYHVVSIPDGQLNNEKPNHPEYIARWYRLEIHNGPDNGFAHNPNAPCCKITIKAVGSRNLTSDIDTTLSVEGAENLKADFLPPDLRRGHELNGAIKTEMIRRFYDLSESRFHMSSGVNRDSNVYSDGFMSDYNHFYTNASVAGKLVISKLDEFYKNQKKKKHIYEQAASLISLLCYFDTVRDVLPQPQFSWSQFKETVAAKMREPLSGPMLSKAQQDFREICEQAEKWFADYKRALNAAKRSKLDQYNGGWPLPRRNKQVAIDKDAEVSALNELYVQRLENVNVINSQLLQVKKQIVDTIQEAESASAQLQQDEGNLVSLKEQFGKQPSMLRIINEQESVVANARSLYQQKVNDLNSVLIKYANLENSKQEAQIVAHMFANEAYVNRSAPYHVVKGMQMNEAINMTIQTWVGSALQQISFRLLHPALHRKAALDAGTPANEAEIAYKNAKYGQRVFDLLFGQNKKALSADELLSLVHNKLPLNLKWAEPVRIKNIFNQLHELQLLNSELEMVIRIKKDTAIPDAEKAERTMPYLKARISQITEKPSVNITVEDIRRFVTETEATLYLSLAASFIVGGYTAKLFNKSHLLWGDVLPSKPTLAYEKQQIFRMSQASQQSFFAHPAQLPPQQQSTHKPAAATTSEAQNRSDGPHFVDSRFDNLTYLHQPHGGGGPTYTRADVNNHLVMNITPAQADKQLDKISGSAPKEPASGAPQKGPSNRP